MCKLKRLEICENYSGLMYSFLSNRYQKVVLNGQSLYWSKVRHHNGIPEGSIIKDLLKILDSNVKLFADDSSVFSVVRDSATENLNEELTKVYQRADQ